jgi:hypothetical protein
MPPMLVTYIGNIGARPLEPIEQPGLHLPRVATARVVHLPALPGQISFRAANPRSQKPSLAPEYGRVRLPSLPRQRTADEPFTRARLTQQSRRQQIDSPPDSCP